MTSTALTFLSAMSWRACNFWFGFKGPQISRAALALKFVGPLQPNCLYSFLFVGDRTGDTASPSPAEMYSFGLDGKSVRDDDDGDGAATLRWAGVRSGGGGNIGA